MLSLTKRTIPEKLRDIKIFNLDARIKTGLIIFAIACQFISGYTEYLGLAPFITDIMRTLNPNHAEVWGNALGVSLAVFMEFLVFYLIGFIIRAIKNEYWTLGLERIDRIFNRFKFGSAIGVLLALIVVSMTLSKKNVKYQIAATPITINNNAADKHNNRQDEKEGAAREQYEADKLALDRSYEESKRIIQDSYFAQIEAVEREIETIERKQERTGKSYRTSILKERKNIASLRAGQANELKVLREQYDKDLRALKDTRNDFINSYTTTIQADKSNALAKEQKLSKAIEQRNKWVAWVLALIAQFSVLGAVISRTWICMSNATSGINEQPLPLPESFTDNVLVELVTLIILFPSRHLQNIVRKGLEKVPNLEPIGEKGAILHLKDKGIEQEKANKEKTKGPGGGYDPTEWETVLGETLGEPEPNKYFSTNHGGQSAAQNIEIEGEVKRTVVSGFLPQIIEQEKARLSGSNIGGENRLENGKTDFILPKKEENSPINRFADIPDIREIQKRSDRSKSKATERAKKRVKTYYVNYLNKHGRKPSYKIIGEALEMTEKTAGKYVRLLRTEKVF